MKGRIIYLKILIKKKINKWLQKYKTSYVTTSKDSMIMRKFSDLYLTEWFLGVIIIIDKFNVNKKEELIQIVKYLTKVEKKIEIVEEEKMLDNNDIKYLAKINKNIVLNTMYVEDSKIPARNEILACDIMSYILIMEKIDYLIQVCKENFKTEEEQIIFIMIQIADYIRYGETNSYKPCLVNAFIMRVGVCIDLSIALWKVLTEMGIECKLITGISNENNAHVLSTLNHAWNQVKLNNRWYNVELTWFNTEERTDMLLVDDDKFSEAGHHNVRVFDNREVCRDSFNRERLKMLITEFRSYKNVLIEYDRGERKIILKKNREKGNKEKWD